MQYQQPKTIVLLWAQMEAQLVEHYCDQLEDRSALREMILEGTLFLEIPDFKKITYEMEIDLYRVHLAKKFAAKYKVDLLLVHCANGEYTAVFDINNEPLEERIKYK